MEVLVPQRFWAEHHKNRANYMQHTQARPMGTGLELYGLRKDGSEFPVEISLSPQHADEGILVSSTIRDVTQRKRVEDSLRQSEASFRAMVEGTYGVYRATSNGTILMANAALAKMLGYDSERELQSRNLPTDVFAENEFSTHILDQPGSRRQFARVETRWRRKDGAIITVEISGRPVHDTSGELLYFEVLAENVSHSRKVEQRLRHLQKMEAIGRLAGGIAHDFNNVLGVISGYAEMLADLAEVNSSVAKVAGDILKASERGGSLTRQLLAFSRQQVLQPRVINIGEHIRATEGLLRRVLGEDIALAVEIGERSVHLRADPGQIEQVIINIVVNARDAMPLGGRLSIEIGDVELDDEYCSRNPDASPGRYARIAIGDTGCGMPPEVQARLFEPFFTTKEPGKGTGLGLATVYGIVRQSGGHVTVYSEVDRGTTFKVYFPLCQEPEAVLERPGPDQEVPTGTETILLVEDEKDLRILTAIYLKGKGYAVLAADSADAAIAIASNHSGPIHLLITDVILPGISGVKLAERLAALRSNLCVLYVSGYTADAIVHQGVQGPNFAFLSKPFSLHSLARKVRSMLDDATVASQKV